VTFSVIPSSSSTGCSGEPGVPVFDPGAGLNVFLAKPIIGTVSPRNSPHSPLGREECRQN